MRMNLYQTVQTATMHLWFSNVLENALVSQVQRRIRIVRFWRSAWLVEA